MTDFAIRNHTTKRRGSKKLERQLCFSSQSADIRKCVYQRHDVGDSLSQWVDIKNYTWLKDHQKLHCKLESDDRRVSLSKSTHHSKHALVLGQH